MNSTILNMQNYADNIRGKMLKSQIELDAAKKALEKLRSEHSVTLVDNGSLGKKHDYMSVELRNKSELIKNIEEMEEQRIRNIEARSLKKVTSLREEICRLMMQSEEMRNYAHQNHLGQHDYMKQAMELKMKMNVEKFAKNGFRI